MVDPFNHALTDLIVGTSVYGNDSAVVNPAAGGNVSVTLNGRALGTFHPTGRIIMYAGMGNDALTVSQSIGLSAFLYAGNGNDTLNGGGGDNVLVGGPGHDSLNGGPARNVDIAGSGLARVTNAAGPNGGSLVIGGATAFDHDETALEALVQECEIDIDVLRRTHCRAAHRGSMACDSTHRRWRCQRRRRHAVWLGGSRLVLQYAGHSYVAWHDRSDWRVRRFANQLSSAIDPRRPAAATTWGVCASHITESRKIALEVCASKLHCRYDATRQEGTGDQESRNVKSHLTPAWMAGVFYCALPTRGKSCA